MYQVTKRLNFSYGHRLLKHAGKCKHLHGHNAQVDIVCESPELDQNAMVVDFDKICEALSGWIKNTLDHRMILSRGDRLVPHLKEWKEPFFLTSQDPTAETLAQVIFERAKSSGLPVKRVDFYETPTSSATYQA